MAESKLFLHNHPGSSYAQKVRLALREKGIPFDMEVPEGLGSGKPIPKLAESNPRLEVPALVDGDFKIFDSKVILAYLEEKYPEKPLLPKDPKARATARMIEEVCDTQYEAINWGILEITGAERATGVLAENMLAAAKKQIAIIHEWLIVRLGDKEYFNGNTFGYADIAVVPYVNRTFLYDMLDANSPIGKWRARVMQRPSVKQTFEELETATNKMMETFKDWFKPGTGLRREYRDHRLEWMIKSGGLDIITQGLRDKNIRFSWPDGI